MASNSSCNCTPKRTYMKTAGSSALFLSLRLVLGESAMCLVPRHPLRWLLCEICTDLDTETRLTAWFPPPHAYKSGAFGAHFKWKVRQSRNCLICFVIFPPNPLPCVSPLPTPTFKKIGTVKYLTSQQPSSCCMGDGFKDVYKRRKADG